jgi:F-type H+-transporting ATPase subunit gamma
MEKSQEIRSRIKSVGGTRKITKAMEMIASSKIRRAQNRILEARAFIAGIESVITDIASTNAVLADPLLLPHEKKDTVLVLGITADRGLCGGYNSNIIRLIEKTVKKYREKSKTVKLFIIGTRGRNYFRYMGYEMEKVFENLSDYPRFMDAREISRDII